ncbi:probable G-protein coupled receptor 83 [Actinia tenebrosa]|uniref:Probable G-protein coupled receptor 83 n=1 Tax=Actinia tenebrosa TaxID=6105 RepID=A0A6P8J0Z0_ACTTE|nr:probable G-protein coupled receptor 83 [Actinia tenebrosa]
MEVLSNFTQAINSSTKVNQFAGYITEPRPVVILRLTIESFAAFLGVIGSILVCLVVPKGDKGRSAGSLYMISLAIADLLILVVNFPIAVIKEQSPTYWPLGKEMCYALYPLLEMFHAACIWSIVAIAVERYRGIICTRRQSQRSVKLTIAVIWVGSFILFVTPLLFIITYTENAMGTFCYLKWPSQLFLVIYNVMDTILLYVLPLAVISYTYLRITREINASSVLHKRLSKSAKVRRDEELKRVKQNTRTKKLLTPLVVVFTISMFPINAFRVALLCLETFTQHRLFLIFYNICVIGVVLNSVADPIIYSIVTKDFLSRLKSMLSRDSSIHEKNSSMTVLRPADRETDV